MASLADPLLWQSPLSTPEMTPGDYWRRFLAWWTPHHFFNYLLPLLAFLLLWLVLKNRYEQQQERQDLYVPAPFRSVAVNAGIFTPDFDELP